ncbi:tetratricopeptide repeat protein [Metabacillus iocasae]|uniref:Tetratricopeptide (TPR) repeat protein n=1 Tax=Priestia iocasae TaxID=2291674 RepID=A0ABS2QTY5_9BACI|nr:tetratricopeptide repeat protein [Metabacillus iocasae]MBM7702936.1 tetratricopeptide (TPR) repeat protein [Metabacillus iocasae]
MNIDKAIELRKSGKLKESNNLLLTLIEAFPEDACVHYQCAWSFDALGEEAEAVRFYERALELGLNGEDLEGALLGLGSTYRTLGKYEESKETFEKGMRLFPNNYALKVFYSMTLYNLNEHQSAMELLLKCLLETTENEDIQQYKKAIAFYSDKLSETWT